MSLVKVSLGLSHRWKHGYERSGNWQETRKGSYYSKGIISRRKEAASEIPIRRISL
jgi:hypothetical protein